MSLRTFLGFLAGRREAILAVASDQGALRLGLLYRDESPPLLDVLEVLIETPVSPWVREAYVEALTAQLVLFPPHESKERIRRLLTRMPEGPAILRDYSSFFEKPKDDNPSRG